MKNQFKLFFKQKWNVLPHAATKQPGLRTWVHFDLGLQYYKPGFFFLAPVIEMMMTSDSREYTQHFSMPGTVLST